MRTPLCREEKTICKRSDLLTASAICRLLPRAWPHGIYRLHSVRKIKNIGAYVSKYLGKEFTSSAALPSASKNLKRYMCSRGLKRPQVIHNCKVAQMYNASTIKLVGTRIYKLKYKGCVELNNYCVKNATKRKNC